MKDKTPTPTIEEKVKQYEDFLHNINMMLVSGSIKGVQKLIDNADSWSYSHRVGNGELTEEQQQELINRAFWNLNNINLD
jgi:exopolyphosphatase/pppGpp-phosphohydrolase